jgi:Fe-S cluster assembly protein SufD
MNLTQQADLQLYLSEKFSEITDYRNNPLRKIQQEAFENFEKLGFPTTRHEEWKYANVQPWLKNPFQFESTAKVVLDADEFLIPGLQANTLVFVNGVFQAHLSDFDTKGFTVCTFAEALEKYPEKILAHFAQYADFQTHAFTALNTALAENGVFIHIPEGKIIEKPIVIYQISEATQPTIANLRHLFIAEKNSQFSLIEHFAGKNKAASFTNTVTEIVVEADARVNYIKIQQEDQNSYHIGTTQVYQQRDSYFSATTVTLSGVFVRNNLHLVLDAENCEAHMFGLYLPNQNQFVDNHTLADHRKPNSYSNELYKGILDGKSVGVFNGKIFVRRDAQKTNAFQSNRSLVLSEEATMNTKPQLEIFADDVKCSHGAAIGQLDENMLFYLQARGIPVEVAKGLLMLAFANKVLLEIKNEPLRAYLEKAVSEKMKG